MSACDFMMLAGLTGCGRELSTEENRVIAEYAADLLLKYDKNYQSKYMNTEDETEAVTTTEQDTEATTEETVTEAINATETVNTTEAEGEDSIIPPLMVAVCRTLPRLQVWMAFPFDIIGVCF